MTLLASFGGITAPPDRRIKSVACRPFSGRSTIRRWSKEATDVREPLLNFFLERYEAAYKAELEAFVDALFRSSGSLIFRQPRAPRKVICVEFLTNGLVEFMGYETGCEN